MRAAIITALVVPAVANLSAQAVKLPPDRDTLGIFSGVLASRFNENIFSPCDVQGIGSGWRLRFNNERDGRFLVYGYKSSGMPTVSHFVRVRGLVSPSGHYGDGFQTREILVDSVLAVSDSLEKCVSYEDLPQVWEGVKSSGAHIVGAAATDNRSFFALLDREGFLNVWDVRTERLVSRFESQDEGGLAGAFRVTMAFSHDGKRLSVGGLDGVVRVWDPLTGNKVWTLPALDTMSGTVNGQKMAAVASQLDFNTRGDLLASNVGERISIWSMETGKRVATFKEGWWHPRFLFIGDSSFIASGDSGVVKVYPSSNAAALWRFKTPLRNFEFMERSPDGRWLFLKGWGDTAYVWSVADGKQAHTIPIPNWFGHGAVTFSNDGKILATSGGANGLYLWDMGSGKPLRSFLKFPSIVINAWFDTDNRTIIVLPMFDTVLRVVRLEGASVPFRIARPAVPTQAVWPPTSAPSPRPSTKTFGSVVGFVYDDSKKPVVGAEVSIFDGDRPGTAPLATTTTNAAGRYLIQAVPVRHVTVRAMMPGYAPDVGYAHLPLGAPQVDFELKPNPVQK